MYWKLVVHEAQGPGLKNGSVGNAGSSLFAGTTWGILTLTVDKQLRATVATSSKARPALSRLLLFQLCATGRFIRVHLSLAQSSRWFFLCTRELEQFSRNRCRIQTSSRGPLEDAPRNTSNISLE